MEAFSTNKISTVVAADCLPASGFGRLTFSREGLLDKISKNKGFKIAALNINSLPAHIDKLRAYVTTGSIDILALNETKLDQSIPDTLVSIPGYTLERHDRNRHGGRVALYIRNVIHYERMHEIKQDPLEWLCIKVIKPKTKPFIVGTWYRPPISDNTMNSFELLINKLEAHQLEVNTIGEYYV